MVNLSLKELKQILKLTKSAKKKKGKGKGKGKATGKKYIKANLRQPNETPLIKSNAIYSNEFKQTSNLQTENMALQNKSLEIKNEMDKKNLQNSIDPNDQSLIGYKPIFNRLSELENRTKNQGNYIYNMYYEGSNNLYNSSSSKMEELNDPNNNNKQQ
jgi:hypothetical protein